MDEIRALAAAGHGVLFTTHDPKHAAHAADRAFLMREGARVAEGDVATVLTRENLEELYGTPIRAIVDRASDATALLPRQGRVGFPNR